MIQALQNVRVSLPFKSVDRDIFAPTRQFLLTAVCGRNAIYLVCYLLVILGVIFRVEHIFQFNPIHHVWSDPQRHWEQGTRVLESSPMAMTDPIMYQLYIGMLGKLTLQNPMLIAFYTSLLAIVTPWVWYRFARELQPSRLLATGLWAALSVLPSWITIYAYFMQETLLLPLLGAALYATWRCQRKQTLASFLLMVVFWTIAGLTRGIAIPLAAVAATYLWLSQKQKVSKAVYSLLLLGLIMGPLTFRAYSNMHLLAPHGIGQMVALYTRSGNREIHIEYRRDGARWNYWFGSPSTGEHPLLPFSNWTTKRSGRVNAQIDINKGSEDWNTALAAQPLTPSKYLWLTGENLLYLFFGSSWPDNNQQRWLERMNYHGRWIWVPILFALLLWSAFSWRRLQGRRLLFGMLLTWILVQGLLPISVNEGRYRKPGEGIILAHIVLLLAVRRRRQASSASAESGEASVSAVNLSPVIGERVDVSQNIVVSERKVTEYAAD